MDTTNRNTALASAFVEELARCGLRHAVIAPGSRSTPVALALLRQPTIETAVIVDERSAGYFAVGAAQATGQPVAVLCTSGTAAANLHPAVCEADEAGVPLIVLTADRPPELRGIGAGQTIDQLKLYGDATRWFCEAGTQEADDAGLLHLRSTACRAWAAAHGEPRPGPAHVNLSWRDPLGPEPAEGEVSANTPLALEGRGERPLTAVAGGAAAPDDSLLDELADRIVESPGVIVCGRDPAGGHGAAIATLAAACGYPILAEPTSQLRFGRHDRSSLLWAYEGIARAEPRSLAPELVIRFGDMPTCKPLREWIARLAPRQVVVDPSGGWNEPTRGAETIVRANPRAVAEGIATRLRSEAVSGRAAWLRAWLAAHEAATSAIGTELALLTEPTEPSAHAALSGVYGEGDIVYTASSMPIRDQEAFVEGGEHDVHFLCNRGANGIDGLVSSGIGASWAADRPAWIVTGDVGLVHDIGGLASLRHAREQVRIVCLNNDGGGIFEFLPQAEQLPREEFETLFGTPHGISFERAAALFEIAHRQVDDLRTLAQPDHGHELIEIRVDRRANVELHRRIGAAVTDAVASVTDHNVRQPEIRGD